MNQKNPLITLGILESNCRIHLQIVGGKFLIYATDTNVIAVVYNKI